MKTGRDDRTLGNLAKVAVDHGLLNVTLHTCEACGFHTVATNRVCPFCKKHLKEQYMKGAPDGVQTTTGSRMIEKLAKSLIVDRENPGFGFPYRGCHTEMWRQMQTLLEYERS